MKKDPELFSSSPSRIPVFQTNMGNTSRVESSRAKLFVFWTIYGEQSNNYSTMTHLYKYLMPDSSKNSTFILKNSANNLIFASIFDSILDSRSSNSISILQFSYSASTRLRLQSFDVRLDNEPRVGTPLRRYLTNTFPNSKTIS